MKNFDVFLSYNWGVKPQVTALYRELTGKQGLKVWMDDFELGQERLADELSGAIYHSKVFMCCITKKYCESENCKDELDYAKNISRSEIKDGGLYMPLLIRRNDFWRVGGYPEGNLTIDSDIFEPKIAIKGDPCISGDEVLMRKLASVGIKHQTDFNSIVYHFQAGEMDSQNEDKISNIFLRPPKA